MGNSDFTFERDIETMSRGNLADFQKERLRWTLDRAYSNVPYYQRSFRCSRNQTRQLKVIKRSQVFSFYR